MPNDDISSRALSAIRQEDLEPKPKIAFTSKEIAFWTLAVCALAVGSLAFAVVLVRLGDLDWDLVPRLGVGVFLRAAPIFWLASAAVFLAFGERYYRATRFGYRTRLALIVAAYVGTTAVLGSLAYAAGMGDAIERALSSRVPIYRHLNFTKDDMWTRPTDGLLAGRIQSMEGTRILLVDFGGRSWDVDASKAMVRRRVSLEPGALIKIIGEATGEGTFGARDIRPWDPPFRRPMAPPPRTFPSPVPAPMR
ncbi:hypothetical protein L0Y59_01990 [Candidatus Uhrbacteria bacterium]|nr:hypothetical protein [Candidatus Uhrbacteria bacterium]